MTRSSVLSLSTLAMLSVLAGCKILPTPTAEDKTAAAAETFDPDRMVKEIWDAKVLPYLAAKAGSFPEVSQLAMRDPAVAGQKYGNPRKQANSPWTYVAKAEGRIVAANTQSRAATIDIDADGDGKADLRVQIGPALRGTALRDALDFVDFNAFKNQIDFAQFGKAFNTYANSTVLSKLPRDKLEGRTATLLGAYVPGSATELPLMTPADVTFGAAP